MLFLRQERKVFLNLRTCQVPLEYAISLEPMMAFNPFKLLPSTAAFATIFVCGSRTPPPNPSGNKIVIKSYLIIFSTSVLVNLFRLMLFANLTLFSRRYRPALKPADEVAFNRSQPRSFQLPLPHLQMHPQHQ